MKKAPCYKGGGRIKGEPEKPKTNTIDRSKYASKLAATNPGNDDFVGERPDSFTPSVLEANGFKYHSGTMGNKDIAYEKNGNIFLYNEQPTAAQNKYRLTNIGNPFTSTDNESTTTIPSSVSNTITPSIDPNRKPLDLSNPNLTYDPNTGSYKNPVTGANINPIVEQYKDGGRIKKAPMKGYAAGGTTGGGNSFISAFGATNQRRQDQVDAENQAKKDKQNAQAKAGLNTAGRVLGGVGTAYYASNPGDTAADNTRAATLGAVSNAGPVGGVIGGVAAIGDKIGAPIKAKSERMDDEGNLIDPTAAKRNAVIGGLFSPSKALSERSKYKGGFTDISGNGYLKYLEDKAKNDINSERQAALDAEEVNKNTVNQNNFLSALQSRDDNEIYDNSDIYRAKSLPGLLDTSGTDSQYGGKSWFKRTFADGGTIKGKGTGKSDDIKAVVKEDTFIVPVENAEIAEELREKILRKAPKKKANLNQSNGESVRLSNGEHMFSPEEKLELEIKGVNVDALAPNAKGGEEVELADGGKVNSKSERDKIKAEEEALRKAKETKDNQSRSLSINKNTLKRQDEASKRLIEADRNLKALEKEYEDYNNRIPSARSTTNNKAALAKFDEQARIDKKALLDKIDQANQARESANNEYKQANFKSSDTKLASSNAQDNIDYLNGSGRSAIKTDTSTIDYTPSTSTKTTSTGKRAPVINKANKSTVSADNLDTIPTSSIPYSAATESLYGDRTPAEIARMNQTPVLNADTQNNEVTPAGNTVANPTVTPTENVNNKANKFDYSNILGNAINYGIPIAQTAIGLNQLKKAGDRPVDSLDADYVNSLNQTRAGVQQAKDQAKYGFTGQQLTELQNQNNQLTNAGRYAARNFSGGSAGNALNMERSVINDSFGRALSTQVSDKNLQLQKQQEAFQRQQVLNNQIQDKQDRLRQYFGDDLNAWHQKTQSAANLTQAGLTNALDSYRADQRLKNFNAQMSQANNFNQPTI